MDNRQEKCRYIHRMMGKNHDESHCVVDGWEDDEVRTVTEVDCAACGKYKNRYIEYPITVSGIDDAFRRCQENDKKCGKLVKVRPCGKEYGDKTYLGILLGDLPARLHITHDPESLVLKVRAVGNPAIFIPELKKIVFGVESYWGEIERPEDLKHISDADISNVWYVRALEELSGKTQDKIMCPNGCGEMETARGQVGDGGQKTYWDVSIQYCPRCMYTGEVNADL